MTTRATVCIAEDAETLIADGDLLAIRQRGTIELWSASGEIHMGNMLRHASTLEIRIAAQIWLNGYSDGIKAGRDEAQAKLRIALGLEP